MRKIFPSAVIQGAVRKVLPFWLLSPALLRVPCAVAAPVGFQLQELLEVMMRLQHPVPLLLHQHLLPQNRLKTPLSPLMTTSPFLPARFVHSTIVFVMCT